MCKIFPAVFPQEGGYIAAEIFLLAASRKKEKHGLHLIPEELTKKKRKK